MKYLSLKKSFSGVIAIFAAVTLFASCSDKDPVNPMAGYPKDVNIEYRIKSSTPGITKADVAYDNQTGGRSTLDDAALPFSVKFKRKVEYGTTIAISGHNNAGGVIVIEILADDKVVKTETFTATSYVGGTVVYGFN
ncbi:hypothetical protein [Chitinophaga sp. 22620]|uniref:hypothetical protein n=1 Tax=Chitinophaga sp. 22620 TaxID=3453952 RepID=UPI003F878173